MLVRVLVIFLLENLLVRENLRLLRWQFACLLKGVLQLFERSFVASKSLARSSLIHLLRQARRQIFREISWRVLRKINTLSSQQCISLLLDDIHFLAEFDFATIQIH